MLARITALAPLALLAACAASTAPDPSAGDDPSIASSSSSLASPSRDLRIMPVHASKLRQASGVVDPQPGPAGAKLVYRGGKIVQHPTYTNVFWGKYWSTAAGAAEKKHVDGFFATIAPSPQFWSVVHQYAAKSLTIGEGTVTADVDVATDPPSTIDDADIEAQLQKWIAAKVVPPASDDQIYVLNFPKNVTVTMDGSASCTDFCGYHSAFSSSGGKTVRYVVSPHPDCDGCAFESKIVDSMTVVLSHEMSETVTDPDVGLAITTNDDKYLGWYDDANGEIGDICAGITDADATELGYRVQTEWSNADEECVASRVIATPDFTLAASPASATVKAGKATTFTVTTTAVQGYAKSVALGDAGLPAGVTATFSADPIAPGGHATLKVATTAKAKKGTYAITVTGKSGALTHTAKVKVTID